MLDFKVPLHRINWDLSVCSHSAHDGELFRVSCFGRHIIVDKSRGHMTRHDKRTRSSQQSNPQGTTTTTRTAVSCIVSTNASVISRHCFQHACSSSSEQFLYLLSSLPQTQKVLLPSIASTYIREGIITSTRGTMNTVLLGLMYLQVRCSPPSLLCSACFVLFFYSLITCRLDTVIQLEHQAAISLCRGGVHECGRDSKRSCCLGSYRTP